MVFFNRKKIKFDFIQFVLAASLFILSSVFTHAQVAKDAWVLGIGASMPKVSLSWNNIGAYLAIQRNFSEHTGLRLTGNYNSITRGFGDADESETKTTALWSSLDMIYYFTPCNAVSPFIVAGIGINNFSHDNPQHEPLPDESETVFQISVGLGVEVYLAEDWKLKPEIGFYTPMTDYYDGRYGSNGGGIFGASYDAVVKGDVGVQWYFSKGEPSKICQLYDGIEQEDKFNYDNFEKTIEKYIPREVVSEKVVVKNVSKKNHKLFLMGVNFEFNNIKLTPESYPVLYHVSKKLEKNPQLRIEIEGHCDSIGTVEVNQRISQQRADVVKNYMLERGIDESRIKSVGKSSSKPIADNSTAEGRAMNRRIEFKVVE